MVEALMAVSWTEGGGRSGVNSVRDEVFTKLQGISWSDRVGHPWAVAASTRTSYSVSGTRPETCHVLNSV